MSYGAVFTNHVSGVSSPELLKAATIDSKLFNRNANVAEYEKQEEGTCYAHAATSAYLNSCAAIHPQKEWPSWKECLEVAVKGRNGGLVSEALERLEEKFNMGIEWKTLKNGELKIRDVLMTSIVIGFHTTEQGFCNINDGRLTKKPFGIRDPVGHATLIESFDFESGYYICKNSWGDLGESEPRFQLDLSALHDYTVYKVHWTPESLAKKKKPLFIENYGAENTVIYKEYKLHTRQMDEKTALCSAKYICERELDDNEKVVWVGYEVDKLIEIKLKTIPKLVSSKVPQTDLPHCILPRSTPKLEVTNVGPHSEKFAFSKGANGILWVYPPITEGVVRWMVSVEYGCADSSFVIGAVPSNYNFECPKLLDEVAEAMTFSFTNKGKTMSSCLSGIHKNNNNPVNPRETMVEHTSTVSIEVDCNMRIISFFVNDVKVPHVITDIKLPLRLGMSMAGDDMSVTSLSLCRLSISTPSIVKLVMHKAKSEKKTVTGLYLLGILMSIIFGVSFGSIL